MLSIPVQPKDNQEGGYYKMKKFFVSILVAVLFACIQSCGPLEQPIDSRSNSIGGNIHIVAESYDGIDTETVKGLIIETLDPRDWASISVLVEPKALYLALASKTTWGLEFMQIEFDSFLTITSVEQNIAWPYSARANAFYASCPNSSIDTYWTTECSTISTAVAAVDTNHSAAVSRGYKSIKAIGSGESLTNVLNYLSCSNLKLWGRVGHGYTGGLQLTAGQMLSDFPGVSIKSGVYANSCQAHNPPFEGKVLGAGARFFISGDVNLKIGSSEEVFKCWWNKAKDQHNVCSALSACEKETGYKWPGDHGCSGPNQTVLPPSSTPIPPPKPPTGCGRILPGEGLGLGKSVRSCDNRFNFVMQHDGNLVLYHGGQALWSSITHGKPSYGVYMQGDGNLVIYTQQAQPLWHTSTHGNPGAWLAVQNDGNVVIYTSANKPIWATNTVVMPVPKPPAGCGRILPGEGLGLGQSVRSCDNRFNFVMQHDGNLVLYHGGQALWSSVTHGKPSYGVYMQGDGNLVIYTLLRKPLWHTSTHGNPGAWLAVQNDGNVVIYTSANKPIWATNTCCR